MRQCLNRGVCFMRAHACSCTCAPISADLPSLRSLHVRVPISADLPSLRSDHCMCVPCMAPPVRACDMSHHSCALLDLDAACAPELLLTNGTVHKRSLDPSIKCCPSTSPGPKREGLASYAAWPAYTAQTGLAYTEQHHHPQPAGLHEPMVCAHAL